MASAPWSKLPAEIISIVAKILNTDVDILHLRAVCTSWRSSIRPRLRPSPFPLKVPSLSSFDSNLADKDTPGLCVLNYTTLYRISPPEYGPHAGDPSDGWLFRVLEVNPNKFRILSPLVPDQPKFPSRTIPKYLNLVDYRITEICKCYNLTLFFQSSVQLELDYIVRKVIILNALGCDFVALILFANGIFNYWKLNNESWIRIDTKGHKLTDIIICDGKCYAISAQGLLLLFDSNLVLTVSVLPPLPLNCFRYQHYLVVCNSDLYVISKVFELRDVYDGERFPTQFKVFKKCKYDWRDIMCLGDLMFLSSNDVSIGLTAEDFRGKDSCVYVAHVDYSYVSILHFEGQAHFALYWLGGDRTWFTRLSANQLSYWRPPAWLKQIAKDDYISGSSG